MTFSASSGRIVIAKSTRWSQVRSATTVGPEFYKTNTPNVTSHEQGGEATKGRKSLRPQRVGCRERERERSGQRLPLLRLWAAPAPFSLPRPPYLQAGARHWSTLSPAVVGAEGAPLLGWRPWLDFLKMQGHNARSSNVTWASQNLNCPRYEDSDRVRLSARLRKGLSIFASLAPSLDNVSRWGQVYALMRGI